MRKLIYGALLYLLSLLMLDTLITEIWPLFGMLVGVPSIIYATKFSVEGITDLVYNEIKNLKKGK